MNFVKNAPNFACSFVYVCQTMFCMFFPWSLLSFWNITYAKKHIFPRAFSGDLLLNEKQKKPFVSLSDEVTIIASFSYYCFVSAGGVRRWTCQVRICFAETPVRYEVAQFFFPFCSFSSLKNQDIYLKKLCMELESGEIFYTGYCWWKHTTQRREFRSSVKAERSDALQLFRIIS